MTKAFNPRKFMELAIEAMRQTVSEPRKDGKAIPLVGASSSTPSAPSRAASCRSQAVLQPQQLGQADFQLHALFFRQRLLLAIESDDAFETPRWHGLTFGSLDVRNEPGRLGPLALAHGNCHCAYYQRFWHHQHSAHVRE